MSAMKSGGISSSSGSLQKGGISGPMPVPNCCQVYFLFKTNNFFIVFQCGTIWMSDEMRQK